jgi:hypothetical protein
MIEVFRDCPDCGTERGFVQRHRSPEYCPDAADGCCPEWFCAACGAGLFLGSLATVPETARSLRHVA